MLCAGAVTRLTADTWHQALKPEMLRLTHRVCGMTGETLSGVLGRQFLAEGSFQGRRFRSGCPRSEIQSFDGRIETDTAFKEGSLVLKQVRLAGRAVTETVAEGYGDGLVTIGQCVQAAAGFTNDLVGIFSVAED